MIRNWCQKQDSHHAVLIFCFVSHIFFFSVHPQYNMCVCVYLIWKMRCEWFFFLKIEMGNTISHILCRTRCLHFVMHRDWFKITHSCFLECRLKKKWVKKNLYAMRIILNKIQNEQTSYSISRYYYFFYVKIDNKIFHWWKTNENFGIQCIQLLWSNALRWHSYL